MLNYSFSFYVIFRHISQNLLVLREQLSFIEVEDVQSMRDAVYTKYIMFKYVLHASFFNKFSCILHFSSWYNSLKRGILFKVSLLFAFALSRKFRGAMQVVAVAEIAVWISLLYLVALAFRRRKNTKSTNLIGTIIGHFDLQIFINMDNSLENYWLRLLVRELSQFCIFLYIGYVFFWGFQHGSISVF